MHDIATTCMPKMPLNPKHPSSQASPPLLIYFQLTIDIRQSMFLVAIRPLLENVSEW